MDRQSAKGVEGERGEVRYGGEYLVAGGGPWGSRPSRAGEVEYAVDTVDQNCAGLCWGWIGSVFEELRVVGVRQRQGGLRLTVILMTHAVRRLTSVMTIMRKRMPAATIISSTRNASCTILIHLIHHFVEGPKDVHCGRGPRISCALCVKIWGQLDCCWETRR